MGKVYTAIAGDYPLLKRSGIQCFKEEGIFVRPVMEAKRYKILPHLFLDDDVTIWLDGNISLRVPVQEAVDKLLGDADIGIFRHPFRATVWDEFDALRSEPRFDIPYLQKQLVQQWQAYRMDGLPRDAQPYECNMMIRRNNPRVNRLMDAWWAQICRWQWRDQVSLPYVLWKYGDVKIQAHTANVRHHPLFAYVDQYQTATP